MAFTFRPSDEATAAMEKIKKDNGIATNSKAIEYALRNFQAMDKALRGTEKQLDKTELELRNIKMTLTRKTETDLAYTRMISELVSK